MASVHVVYEINRSGENYYVEYFDRSEIGISPDKLSPVMNLAQLLEWLKDAEPTIIPQEPKPPVASGVVCVCPADFCPAHGRIDKSELRKGRKVRE